MVFISSRFRISVKVSTSRTYNHDKFAYNNTISAHPVDSIDIWSKYVAIVDDGLILPLELSIFSDRCDFQSARVFDESNTKICFIGKLRIFVCDIFDSHSDIPSIRQLLKDSHNMMLDKYVYMRATNVKQRLRVVRIKCNDL